MATERYERIKEAVTSAQVARDHGLDVGPDGNGREEALCPWHKDKNPSLKFFQDGGFNCFACDDVNGDAVDLERMLGGHAKNHEAASELENRHYLNHQSGERPAVASQNGSQLPQKPKKHAPEPAKEQPKKSKPKRVGEEARWLVRDEHGEAMALHIRFKTRDGHGREGKDYALRNPDGSFTPGALQPSELPLYFSEHVSSYDPGKQVLLCEGEKAADAAAAAGIPVVATAFGTNVTPVPERLEILRGFRVVLWPDADAGPKYPGQNHMADVGDALQDIASEVQWYEWPEASEKDDAADHPAVISGDPEMLGELQKSLREAPSYDPAKHRPPDPKKNGMGNDHSEDPGNSKEEAKREIAGRVSLAEMVINGVEPPEELEPEILVKGRVHSIFGPASSGKSWVTLWLAKRCIERGERVLLLDDENGPKIAAERLREMGTPTERLDDLLHYYVDPDLPMDRKIIEAYVRLLDELEPSLVIFDSLIGFLAGAGFEENSNDGMALWAKSYTRPARSRGMAVVMLDHVGHEGGRYRGASRKKDAVDIMWALTNPVPFDRNTVGEIQLRREKDREGVLPANVKFSIGGGSGENGFVLRRSDGTVEATDTEGLTDSAKRLLDILDRCGEEGTTWKQMEVEIGSKGTLGRALENLGKRNLFKKENFRYYRNPPAEPRNLIDKPDSGGPTRSHTSTAGPVGPEPSEGGPTRSHTPMGWDQWDPGLETFEHTPSHGTPDGGYVDGEIPPDQEPPDEEPVHDPEPSESNAVNSVGESVEEFAPGAGMTMEEMDARLDKLAKEEGLE